VEPAHGILGGATRTQGEDDNDAEEEAKKAILVLNIRSAKYPNHVTIAAKHGAKASSVLAKYLKKVGENSDAFNTTGDPKMRGKPHIKLSFDGEELVGNTAVGSVGAEDEDVWDVVGL